MAKQNKTEQEFMDEINEKMEMMKYYDSARVDRNIYDPGSHFIVKSSKYTSFAPQPKAQIITPPDTLPNHIPIWFEEKKVVLSNEEQVNDYNLFRSEQNVFTYENFMELYSIWKQDEQYTFEQFQEECSEIMCTDWYKMDYNGEPYGGFYKYPDGSEEKDNAWELTIEDNIKRLYGLPYPKDFVFETIKIGCRNRNESVKYSNYLCVWFERKIKICQNELV